VNTLDLTTPLYLYHSIEEEPEKEPPVAHHTRRASVSVANRFSQPQANYPTTEVQNDRGTNLLRRLSLSSGAFTKVSLALYITQLEAYVNEALSPAKPKICVPSEPSPQLRC